jgi:hypothetical protein
MENRWSARIDSSVKIVLYHNRIPVITCQSSNIGLGGIHVNSGPMIYPRNTLLEAKFQLDSDLGPKIFQVQTAVVYSDKNGLGLMFIHSNAILTRTIRQLLHNSEKNKTSVDASATRQLPSSPVREPNNLIMTTS